MAKINDMFKLLAGKATSNQDNSFGLASDSKSLILSFCTKCAYSSGTKRSFDALPGILLVEEGSDDDWGIYGFQDRLLDVGPGSNSKFNH